MSAEPRKSYSPLKLYQQELQEFRFQHLATDSSGWVSAVPWFLTTINRVKMMAAGVARIIPFLPVSGTPTAIGINRSGVMGSSGDAAPMDHEHATPDIATEEASGWMGSSHVVSVNANTAHRNTTGNPHNTQIGDIPNLSATLSAKADLVGGLIPLSQIPGSLEDLIEYPTRNDFPATGASGRIYLALDTNHQWRWSGSQYIDMTSESGDQYNMGTILDGNGDPFTNREAYGGRGGVRTGIGEGPFGGIWYNIVDVRHRNQWITPGDIWGGELVWGMTASTTRMAFRSRSGSGVPTAWKEVSTVGHGHAIADVSGLRAELDGKLARVPVNINTQNCNSFLTNGIFVGANVLNAPNTAWGVLRVHRNGADDGDHIWQTWTSAPYAGNQEFRRASYDSGSTWTAWQSNKELDGLGLMQNLAWQSTTNVSWIKVCTLRATGQYVGSTVSGMISAGAGAVSGDDNAIYAFTARLKQQTPMTSPIDIVRLDHSLLTGTTAYAFGYVVSADSATEKLVTIYVRRDHAYTWTTAAILGRIGETDLFQDVTETEPPGIVYVGRSTTAPVQKRTFTIGDGSTTSFTLAHYLGTDAVRVTVRETASPYNMVECVDQLDPADPANKVVVSFLGYVPPANSFKVTVLG